MVVRCLMKVLYATCTVICFFILFNSTAEPAHAYIDPGSGLLVLQILGTTFAGMMFVLRKKIRNLFEFFGKWSTRAGNDIANR